MALSKEELKIEESKLSETLSVINDQIEHASKKLFEGNDDYKTFQKVSWETYREMDSGERMNFFAENEERIGKLTEEEKYVKKLYKVKDSPYFGSIIFNDELIYIGLTSVKKDLDHLVCDWRAPICGLYYDYGLGKAQYKCPDGVEKGTITRKRQYKIEKSKLKQVFDTSEQISDEMLQNVLAQSSSDKMKNIVNTIQKEQNEVIRNSEDRNLIVQGIAGSGKTSVALHRIAYLLYKLEYLTSSNVVIFSPNNIFAEYISNVLPDLGEENTMQTTYHEFASSFIEEYKGVEPYSAFTERYYKGVRQDNDLIRFKLSDDMGKAIEEFVKYFTKASRFVKKMEYKKKEVEVDELNELLVERFADKPLYERIELIADKINNRYYKGIENDFNHIKNKLFKLVNFPIDCKEIYKAFFKSAIFSNYYNHLYKQHENERNLDEEILRYEDATPFIYMKCLLGGYPYQVYMRQVVVDEAQDYTYLQYKILRHIFKNADFTILGDVNQTVNPFYKYDNLNVLLDLFEDSRYIELTKTYRSSPEIIEFANKILGLSHVSAIRRDQNLPVIKRELSDIKHIGRDINYLHSKYKSVAIITKTIDEANAICNSFKKNFDIISVIDINTETFKTDLVVAPAYGVKGLEFDACLIVNNFDSDPYLYYVAVTRAQHELIVYE